MRRILARSGSSVALVAALLCACGPEEGARGGVDPAAPGADWALDAPRGVQAPVAAAPDAAPHPVRTAHAEELPSVALEPSVTGSATSAFGVPSEGTYLGPGNCIDEDIVDVFWTECGAYEHLYQFCGDGDLDGYVNPGSCHTVARYEYYCDWWNTLGTFCVGDDGGAQTAHWTNDTNSPYWGPSTTSDCNDGNARVNPGANEQCLSTAPDPQPTDYDCDGGAYTDATNAAYTYSLGGVCVTSQLGRCSEGYRGCTGAFSAGCIQIYSAIPETCNDQDDDCDGGYDEGPPTTYYVDNDFDGYGGAAVTWSSICPPPATYRSQGGDCNDTPGSGNGVNPGAAELCDGVNNDCNASTADGAADERVGMGCAVSGQTGRCGVGTNQCSGGAIVCVATSAAIVESCSNMNEDSDCDGTMDDVAGLGDVCDEGDADDCSDGLRVCSGPSLVCSESGFAVGFDFFDDRGDTTYDVSGNNRHGTATGTPVPDWDADGKTGGGFEFYGNGGRDAGGSPITDDDYISVPSAGLSNTEGTFALWLRPGFDGTQARSYGVFQTANGVNQPGYISAFKWDDQSYFRLVGGPGQINEVTYDVGGASGYYVSGQWDHWAFTWSSAADRIAVYRNGALVGQRTGNSWPTVAISATIQIGRGHDRTWLGKVDDVAVYGVALSATQVDAIWRAGRLTAGGWIGSDPAGQNLELCDATDNDCRSATVDGAQDPRTGGACDSSADSDLCTDDVWVCGVSGITCDDVGGSAVDVCNAVDDDCDGLVDEGPSAQYYLDTDLDGWGAAVVSWASVCPAPATYASVDGDCDDTRDDVFPGANEVCDGVDNDCMLGVDDTPDGVGVACSLGYSGPSYCNAGTQVCENGSLYCDPTAFDFGDVTTISVPDGLLDAATGAVGAGAHVMTADESYAYALAYGVSGGAFNGWRYRVYNPRNGWALVDDRTVTGVSSFLARGVLSDGTYLYPVEWTGAAGARVYRIEIATGDVTTGPYVDAPFISGQLDTATSRAYLGSADTGQVLGFAASPWSPPGGMLPAGPSLPAGPATVTGASGLGALAADTRYLFAKQFSTGYPGSATIVRIGTGLGGTTFGQFAGWVGTAANDTQSLLEFDGYVFVAGDDDDSLQRVRVSSAQMETCNGEDDNCNGIADDPGADGCVTFYRDVDNDGFGVTGDTRCLCTAAGQYRASVGGDCNDSDSSAFPGGTEVPTSGVDEDCDGLEVCYVDYDEDGYRTAVTATSPLVDCPTSSGLATSATPAGDCDDDDAYISPGQPEACNRIDDDCDTEIDETFADLFTACDPAGDGASCAAGFRVCDAGGTGTMCADPAAGAFGFDEATGALATDGSSRGDLTVYGGGGWTVGAEGGAIDLDGADDYLRGAVWGAWSGMDEMTISVWVRPDAVSGRKYIASSSGVGDGLGCCWQWRLMQEPDGRVQFEVNDGDDSSVTTTDPVPVGAWTHIVATLRVGDVNRLFVNGVPSGGTATVTANPAFGYPVVGARLYSGTPDDLFDGSIDELRVLPVELNAAAVAAFYADGGGVGGQVTREYCDGVDNDCDGAVDDGFANAIGASCDGPDGDVCADAQYACSADRLDTTCRMGGALAYWSFNYVSGTVRNEAGPAHGETGNMTLVNAAVVDAGGGDHAISTTSSITYGSVANSALSRPRSRELTMTAWIRPTDLAFSGPRGVVVSKEDAFMVAVEATTGTLVCAINTSQRSWFWTGAADITPGIWTHVACTLGIDGLIRTYVNGTLASTSTYAGGLVEDGISAVRVGGRALALEPFKGLTRDVGIWETALTATELAAVMTDGAEVVAGLPSADGANLELCDGADNNCDGAADETYVYTDPQGGFAGIGDSCDGADLDYCSEGAVACAADALSASCSDVASEHDLEACNELDDDCDGVVDDGLGAVTFYRDADGDGYGNPAQSQGFCALPSGGWASNSADCADSSGAIAPTAVEICDGVDNNCDGAVDDSPLPGENGGACVASEALGACRVGIGTMCQTSSDVTRTHTSVTEGGGFIGDWLLIGPFYWSTADDPCTAQPAGQPFLASVAPSAGETVSGRTWWRHEGLASGGPCNGGWGVPFTELYPDSSWFASYYAVTYVHSPVAQTVDMAIGFDDNARVWVNGALAFSGIDCDCFATDESIVSVPLRAGENVVLVENGNVSWDMGFVLRFLRQDDAGTASCAGMSPTGQCPVTDLWVTTEPGTGVMGCTASDPAPYENPCNAIDDDCDGVIADSEFDLDGDGQPECAGDCAPSDPSAYLGAPEVCDYIDNNCDPRRLVDEGFDIGAACDGADLDTCEDGRVICDVASNASFCTDGATALLTFEEAAAIAYDYSGHGHDATIDAPAAISSVEVRNGGSSLAFTGGSAGALRLPAVAVSGSPEFTFAAWVYPTASGPRAVVSALDGTGVGNALLVGTSTWLQLGGVNLDPGGFAAAPLNQWTHIALAVGGGAATLYHNGVVVSGPWPMLAAPLSGLVGDVFVGQELDAGGATRDGCPSGCTTDPAQAFIGSMDDVAWYTYALSAAEVAALSAAFPSIDVNLELCDWRDNDCDQFVDEGYDFGNDFEFTPLPDGGYSVHICAVEECLKCDGADADACDTDAVYSCTQSGRSTECSWGAVTLLDFEKMHDANRFLDLTGSGNHGLLGTAAQSDTVDGRVAGVFNGSTNARVSVDAAVGWRPSFTVSFWVRPSDPATAPETIVSRFTEFAMPGGTCLSQRGFEVSRSGDVFWNCQQLRVNAFRTALQAGSPVWTHFALVHDGSILRVFVNGEQEQFRSDHEGAFQNYNVISTPALGPMVWNSHIWLGQRQTVPDGGFTATAAFEGAIDDFIWLDYPLSPAQVEQVYDTGVPGLHRNYELCDGLDNDCQLAVDDTYVTLGDACSEGIGVCLESGLEVCSDDQLGTQCSAEGLPGVAEVCDGLDNDCDGAPDDGLTRACSTACGPGLETCSGGVWGTCNAPGSTAEVCDGVDNDCNGIADDLPPISCGTGVCAHSVPACVGGAPNACDPFAGATAELCDAIDQDCDGNAANGFPVGGACGAGSGTCAGSGVFVCSGDGSTVVCDTSGTTSPAEICGNGVDDDCDTLIDESNVAGSVAVLGVAIGDDAFDYSTCEVNAGAGTRCAAVTFRVTNTGAEPVSASELVSFYMIDGSGSTVLAPPAALGRVVAPGATEEFVGCWANNVAAEHVDIGVGLAGSCTSLAGETLTGDYRLGVCGPETCDGFDNNLANGTDELPDACGGNTTQVCVHDDAVSGAYLCAERALADDCTVAGCPVGQVCALGACVAGCRTSIDCPGSTVCAGGVCAIRGVAQTPPDAGTAVSSADALPGPRAMVEGEQGGGCSAAPVDRPTALIWAALGAVCIARRRRGR